MKLSTYRQLACTAACALASIATPVLAEPSGEISSPVVIKGETEFEAIYGRLSGGPDSGEDILRLEASHSVSDRLRLAIRTEIERAPDAPRKLAAVSFEAIYDLGRVGGIDVGLYGEYENVLHGTDKLEGKLLLERRAGPFDAKLNLIAAKSLASGNPLAFAYAASADVEAIGELRLGVAAFGGLGSTDDFLTRADNYVGPVVKTEIEGLGPEIEIEAGYLFALGKAKDDSDGQFRLVVEMEF